MRNQPDDVYGSALTPPAGPLFEQGPSPAAAMSAEAAELFGLIQHHRGREYPITIRQILGLRPNCFIGARQVKDLVQELRVIHRKPIGSRRGVPAGYYIIADAADLDETLSAYRNQAVEMFRVVRALAGPARTAELLGQIKLEVA